MATQSEPTTGAAADATSYDVVVIGAGIAGLYAVHHLVGLGYSVVCLESGAGVGGVWYHNRYPGARVDVESLSYSYFFSPELYQEWNWESKLASQRELLAYFEHVAERFDLYRHIRLNSRVVSADWDPERRTYSVATEPGERFTARFIVMATGHLSRARKPDFPGLDEFEGQWVQTAHWPAEDVPYAGKKVAVLGTGSSGVQVIPELAKTAAHVTVFQRTANFGVPAQNAPIDPDELAAIRAHVPEVFEELLQTAAGTFARPPEGPAWTYTPEQQLEILEQRWAMGAHNMQRVFADQSYNQYANDVVGDFVRSKVRNLVTDPDTASKLLPREYPMGTRRLAVNSGYYEAFNRPNVSLVDLKADPIERITKTGITTLRRHYDVDLIVFALGFEAFNGSILGANIRNERGDVATGNWSRGPRSYLGLMTHGFPNLFFITGAGSPSVLANLFVQSSFHGNVIGEILTRMKQDGFTRIEPTQEAEEEWSEHVDDVAKHLLRRSSPNYMVHINKDDGSRRYKPYAAGLNRYVEEVRKVLDNDLEGFLLD
jgi:cation diffusion facilitator CzcD-associated flavoprotein CzcO